MRTAFTHVLVAAILAPISGFGQGPSSKPKSIPDEVEEMVKELRKAQEPIAGRVDDILKEIRKSYFAPSAVQEEKILKDVRKAYLPTAEQEEAIIGEVRKAYYAPSVGQEEKILKEIQKAEAIPLGRPAPDSLASRADGMYRRLDQNNDGLLTFDEMPEQLRRERGKWDKNGDGFVDAPEYRGYFAARTLLLAEERSALPAQGGNGRTAGTAPAARADGTELSRWFQPIDADGDGQISLYEWRTSGRPLEEFLRMDRNDDGFLTVAEAMFSLAGRPLPVAATSTGKGPGR